MGLFSRVGLFSVKTYYVANTTSGKGKDAKEMKCPVTQTFIFSRAVPASAHPLTPDSLTAKELAFVAQSVARNWVELAWTLGLQETDIQEIQKTYRTHDEQSFQMLEQWLHLYSSQQSLPIILIKALKFINYDHLADLIETESQQTVLK